MRKTKYDNEALKYHSEGRAGKIEVIPSKPYSSQRDLSLAYSPGVAEPCKEISKHPEDVYKYTAKGNLVAVISNGSAVLGLGDIGPEAGKPVMEGKGLLFKIFADIDVFDIELDTKDIDKFVETVKIISPTFGGINLEDIKAPECFEIEKKLKKELNIPVMHDDQHGTAIISAAGLLNALEITGKKMKNITVVINGAGAAAVSCADLYIQMGVKRENIIMCDSKGVLNKNRNDLNEMKKKFVTRKKKETLEQSLVKADVFLGLSVGNIVTPKMIQSMAKKPIVFALANPDPEITYEKAIAARKDIIFATGRSDYPNQINNVLGFPYIFRGALDVLATEINDEMKLAAVQALAKLAKESTPETVNSAYNKTNITFGRDYIIPKPLDPRLITTVAPAVAKAAIKSGVSKKNIPNWNAYKLELEKRLGHDNKLMKIITNQAKQNPQRLVLAEGKNLKTLKAAQVLSSERIAYPILLGNKERIMHEIEQHNITIPNLTIIDPKHSSQFERVKNYAQIYHSKMQRQGITYDEALERMFMKNYLGIMMVENGDADAFLSGLMSKYFPILKLAKETVGTDSEFDKMTGMHIVITKKGPFFLADTTVNNHPDEDTLVSTTLLTYKAIKQFNIEPVIAMTSYSNFGSVEKGNPHIVRNAVKRLHKDYPHILVDGEMHANIALNKQSLENKFGFSKLAGNEVNTIIFPNLSSGSITYKVLQELGEGEVIGPILLGLKKSINIVQIESSVREVINMATIAVVKAQQLNKNNDDK